MPSEKYSMGAPKGIIGSLDLFKNRYTKNTAAYGHFGPWREFFMGNNLGQKV